MSGILDLTTILVMYAVSEFISRKTRGLLDTVLVISVLSLVGFWLHLLPKTAFTNSGIDAFGMAIVGIMLTALGTTINLSELRRQLKVVIVAIICALGASVAIILVAILLGKKDYGIVGAPIYAGGNAATLILLTTLKQHNYQTLMTYALAVLTFQNLIGIPIASYALRKEAKNLIQNSLQINSVDEKSISESKLLKLPDSMNTSIMYLAKLALVASLSYGLSIVTKGVINYLVVCFILGIIFYQLGFLDKDIMNKTKSEGLITFLVTVVVLDSLADTSVQQVLTIIEPLILCLVVGTIGIILTAFILSKCSKVSFPMAVALGLTCTFGFPTTMIMSQEIALNIGRNKQERTALESYFLPKMMTAGLVTVTLISVVFAGFAIGYL